MRGILIAFILLASCKGRSTKIESATIANITLTDTVRLVPYDEFKLSLDKKKKALRNSSSLQPLVDFWVSNIADSLYQYWKSTPWDFNGTTVVPQKGKIACGYFVTTLLRDMGVKLNRVALSVCPSSEMMKKLTPGQKLDNQSLLRLNDFEARIKLKGNAVYIIGLDYHTGFIVCDGQKVWFIHSNYINREGVVKEPVLFSSALRSSKTKWLISLTDDKDFMQKWLKS